MDGQNSTYPLSFAVSVGSVGAHSHVSSTGYALLPQRLVGNTGETTYLSHLSGGVHKTSGYIALPAQPLPQVCQRAIPGVYVPVVCF